MVDCKKNSGNYRTLKICTLAIIKDPEMLTFLHDYLKAKTMCKNAVNKLLFVIFVYS